MSTTSSPAEPVPLKRKSFKLDLPFAGPFQWQPEQKRYWSETAQVYAKSPGAAPHNVEVYASLSGAGSGDEMLLDTISPDSTASYTEIAFAAGSYRYVRLQMPGANNSSPDIHEVEVYNL